MTVRSAPLPLLRIPPFPGSKPRVFARTASLHANLLSPAEPDRIIETIRSLRVGGEYWGLQPELPDRDYVLVRVRDGALRESEIRALGSDQQVVSATGKCDPWHLLKRASLVIADADDELCLLAAIAGVPVRCVGDGPFASLAGNARSSSALHEVVRRNVTAFAYFDPFDGGAIDLEQAIELCGFWRALIDRNRPIAAAAGFAAWKRPTVEPLLWPGPNGVRFISTANAVQRGDLVAIWRARTSPDLLGHLQRKGALLVEVEDGFIRSSGLGADCVPPLSIVVDRLGAHFEPGRPSELEELLQHGVFSAAQLRRASKLRETIVDSGISKYGAGRMPLQRRHRSRPHIFVPGQVEDDRAVVSGGAGLASNLELLRRVRAQCPDGYILYKPHPDVEAGHRAGGIASDRCLEFADEIVRDEPISSLLELADEVHVNTSLAGFEALLRGKPVITHGVPFYAGWGLTSDLGPVPPRRSAKRTLDELIAAVLLLYPRYLDPDTGLPCPPEVLVRRLAQPSRRTGEGLVVRLRRLQGRYRRALGFAPRSRSLA